VGPKSSLSKLIDGNFWYHRDPPNRWTAIGSPNAADWIELDLGAPRKIDTVRLLFLDDERPADGKKPSPDRAPAVTPASYVVERWTDAGWRPIENAKRSPETPTGHRPNTLSFPPTDIQKLRFTFTHAAEGKTGLTEIEAWGDGTLPYTPAPPPAGNVAFNPKPEGFPKATASFHDVFGGKPEKAIDGRIIYSATPMNRWTSYGSPNAQDWLQIDLGQEKEIRRLVLHIYDDRGGVQPPEKYEVQTWTAGDWKPVEGAAMSPATPTGSMANTVTFAPVKTSRFRIVFTNKGKARSGLTELEAWDK
jgi:hypothetical protein